MSDTIDGLDLNTMKTIPNNKDSPETTSIVGMVK